MKVDLIEIGKIIPYANNPRNNEIALDKVMASIREFNFRQPIVVDVNNVIVAGHTRLLAAKELGLTHVPVHVAEGLSEAQIKAYRIMDNRSNEEASWDEELLKIELGNIDDRGFNLALTGFDKDELKNLLLPSDHQGLIADDTAPAVLEESITKPGDLWVLGKHRLFCGDSTKPETIRNILCGIPAAMIFTDPPYNVSYANYAGDKILNDNLGNGFYDFLLAGCQNMLKMCIGAVYICMSAAELHTLHRAFKQAGGHWSTFIIWAKNHFALGRSDYQRQYEPILYGWAEGNKRHWCGDRSQSDVWNIAKPAANDLHPTMKPVELVVKAIENSSNYNDIVLDPFAGSGSTLIACEKLERYSRLIELDPRYCDVIIRRWQDFTGKKAMNAESGKLFKEL